MSHNRTGHREDPKTVVFHGIDRSQEGSVLVGVGGRNGGLHFVLYHDSAHNLPERTTLVLGLCLFPDHDTSLEEEKEGAVVHSVVDNYRNGLAGRENKPIWKKFQSNEKISTRLYYGLFDRGHVVVHLLGIFCLFPYHGLSLYFGLANPYNVVIDIHLVDREAQIVRRLPFQ